MCTNTTQIYNNGFTKNVVFRVIYTAAHYYSIRTRSSAYNYLLSPRQIAETGRSDVLKYLTKIIFKRFLTSDFSGTRPLSIIHRVGSIVFSSHGTTETLRVNSLSSTSYVFDYLKSRLGPVKITPRDDGAQSSEDRSGNMLSENVIITVR